MLATSRTASILRAGNNIARAAGSGSGNAGWNGVLSGILRSRFFGLISAPGSSPGGFITQHWRFSFWSGGTEMDCNLVRKVFLIPRPWVDLDAIDP